MTSFQLSTKADKKQREEYEEVAKKLKEAIHQKSGNKAWLQSLVNTKATDASKRILLSKLMEENHATISKELDKIRFSKSIMINNTPNPVPEQPNLVIKDAWSENAVMNDDVKIEVIDLSDLPQELFTQIEDFIKKEIPEASEFTDAEVNDDIIELPVPPKPLPEVVTLEEPDEQMQLEPNSNANSAKLNKARGAFQMSLNNDSELNINSNTIQEMIVTDSDQLICDSNQVNKEIVEVPIRPKPKPQVVTLIEPDEQVQLEPDSNKDSNVDKGLNKQQEENVNENFNEDVDKNVNENTVSSAKNTIIKNFTCQICDKSFKDNWKLKRHGKVHVKAGELLEATNSNLNTKSNTSGIPNTISDSDSNSSADYIYPPTQQSVQNSAKLDQLKVLSEEESSLYQELNLMEEQKNQIMSRLDYLRELRSQILFE